MVGTPFRWVAVVLRPSVAVTIFETEDEREPVSVRVGDVIYDRHVPCSLWVFYDWLRMELGRIIGVRFFLEAGCDELQATLEGLTYAHRDTNGWFELYFSCTRRHRPEISADQDFSLRGVLSSESGEFLLYFGCGFPSEEELEAIRGLDTYFDSSAL